MQKALRVRLIVNYIKEGNSLSTKEIRLTAAIGASAVVTVGAVAVGVNQDRSSLGTDVSSGMSTGATVTESVRRQPLPFPRRRRASGPPRPPKNRVYPDVDDGPKVGRWQQS
jgi:hypothetical protein